ncbi:N-acetylneuraminate synthase family protein [Novosphingobium subterraneum]|uniref:N-acetylneuraminate synthase family protein n=1 Tax=Novosphingobium subterraneum TaxID=48936 RepID=UPI003D077ADF
MKTGIIILTRYNSRRLPGKILMELGGRTVLGLILDRINRAVPDRPVVVATSDEASDDPIAHYCRRAGVACFRGSLNDVAGRFLACAEANGWDYAVRINGDNVFVDPRTLSEITAIADTGVFDLVTNVPGRTFPYGMSVEVVRTAFYREQMAVVSDVGHREHVTSWLYDNPDIGNRYLYRNLRCPAATGLDLALDDADDLDRIRAMLDAAGPDVAMLDMADIVRLAQRQPVASPWRGAAGPMLIAEIGGNHEGDFEAAKALAQAAIGSGADVVKFQIYTGAALVSPDESPDRHAHFKRFELTSDQHIALAEMCRTAGVSYVSSVWDLESLEWIDPYLDFYKIGSGDLTAWPLLREFARRGKPILLSTGLATLDEILQTVAFIQSVDDRYRQPEWLCLMQCTSMYPIPDGDANLCVMDTLRAMTGLSVGYSDHTTGLMALRAATAMGAEVLEFHFTLGREGQTFRDHLVSLTADEVRALKDDIAQITALRGRATKVPQPSEVSTGHTTSFRRAAYPRRPVAAGATITADDLCVLRPAHGTDARDFDQIVGATARHDLEPFRAIVPGVDYA